MPTAPLPPSRWAGLRPRRGWARTVGGVIVTTWTVFRETKAGTRAAALSFSSLLGLGPVIAIIVIVAGVVLGQRDPHLAVNTLNRLIHFVAPQVDQYEQLSAADPTSPGAQQAFNPKLVEIINGFTTGVSRGSAGVFGALSLIAIVLLLFKSIEDVFNEIWGVRRGRSLVMRIVFYWTILTLGAVLFFAAVTLLSAGAFVNVFMERLPFGLQLLRLLRWSLPLCSFALVTGVLTVFYRLIPHTRVYWRAALVGALVVAALLMMNNFLAFFYLRRVILTKSLYGSLGVLPILMFGLYVFWLYVLIGGQISYAVQNADFRNSQIAWSSLGETERERLSLAVFLVVCRRFQQCLPPVSASEVGEIVHVPSQILNGCLNRLTDRQLLTAVPPSDRAPATENRYQPARPLSRLTLLEFRQLEDPAGSRGATGDLTHLDPLLPLYEAALNRLEEQAFFQQSLEALLAEHPAT
jgi:membrane protein